MTTTSTCIICGRTTPGPDRPYCSFGCAAKDGVSIQQLLAESLAKLGATARKPAPLPPASTVPPPTSLPAVTRSPIGEAAPPTENVFSEGDIARDGIAWRDAGVRNDHLTRYLLRAGDTMILAGYGAGLRVERDALIITEGRTHHPQQPLTYRLHRGLHNVSRIVCLDPQGSLSFAAATWCRDESITVTLLGRDGERLATLTPNEAADAALRRCQYLAHERGTAVPIVRELLRRKFAAHLETIMAVHTHLLEADRAMDMLRTAIFWFSLETPPPWLSTIDQLRTYEGRAAAAYFSCWRSFRVRWARGDVKKIPPHWQFFDGRSSPVTARGLPRHAIDPVNAALNYAYGILESGVRQALTSQGFDVACGFLHADLKGRDSLVYDVMEPLRGMVDGLVLRFLSEHVLHYGDITRVNDGSCRLHPQLARVVVAACKLPQETIDQQATWLRETLLASRGGGEQAEQ
jgi:CRISP-associated protein Cas1